MTQKDLGNEWAWSQIEAYADDGLERDDRRLMRETLEKDPELRAALKRAGVVRRELRAVNAPAVPTRLLWRLLGIPSAAPRRGFWIAVPTAVAITLAVAVWVIQPQAPEVDRRAVAVEEFAIAMDYLQKTAAVANQEINGAVALGIREALTVSRDSMLDDESENGG